MKLSRYIICGSIVCLLALSTTSCWSDDEPISENITPTPPDDDPLPDPAATISLIHDGETHSFVFDGYTPLKDKPVTVYYNLPLAGDITKMRILFIFPGEDRDADTHLQLFKEWATTHQVMLFALKYSTDYYPTTTEYILGGMNTKQSAEGLLARDKWNFNYVEQLFSEILLATKSTQTTYDLWGHSAGAQYVHRYVTFMPQARIGRAVACNSGWYSVPDLTVTFPYGMQAVSDATAAMQQIALARQFYVFVGANDTSTAGLNANAGSQAQGENRYERAQYYYNEAQKIAQDKDYTFRWSHGVVPNVAHEAGGMARGTWSVLEE